LAATKEVEAEKERVSSFLAVLHVPMVLAGPAASSCITNACKPLNLAMHVGLCCLIVLT
jgi:hypothetical protein